MAFILEKLRQSCRDGDAVSIYGRWLLRRLKHQKTLTAGIWRKQWPSKIYELIKINEVMVSNLMNRQSGPLDTRHLVWTSWASISKSYGPKNDLYRTRKSLELNFEWPPKKNEHAWKRLSKICRVEMNTPSWQTQWKANTPTLHYGEKIACIPTRKGEIEKLLRACSDIERKCARKNWLIAKNELEDF